MKKDFFADLIEAIKNFVSIIIALALVGSSLFVLNFINCINPFFVGFRTCGYTEPTPSNSPDSYQDDYFREY